MRPQGDPGLLRSAAAGFGNAATAVERTKATLTSAVSSLSMGQDAWSSPANEMFQLAWQEDGWTFDRTSRAFLDTSTALSRLATAMETAQTQWNTAVRTCAGV